jgi:small-conductance mechanosensitive channel
VRRPFILLLLVVLAGCGGGGDSGTLSRADYTKQANASCLEVERKLDALGGFESFEELSREMKTGQQALEQSVEELSDLNPPAELAARHGKLVELQQETADLAGRLSIAAGDNDQVEMQKQAERADQLTRSANEVARQLGLQECVAG